MNYARIIPHDIGNGPGIRVSLFVSGCTNNCPGCFNKETHDFNYGKPYNSGVADEILEYIKDPVVSGLSILGGDPMCQSLLGKYLLYDLCSSVKHRYKKNVWLWTGYTWGQVLDTIGDIGYTKELLSVVDVMVDGPFVEAQKDLSLEWRGSANQRIINVQESLKRKEVVLWQT